MTWAAITQARDAEDSQGNIWSFKMAAAKIFERFFRGAAGTGGSGGNGETGGTAGAAAGAAASAGFSSPARGLIVPFLTGIHQ